MNIYACASEASRNSDKYPCSASEASRNGNEYLCLCKRSEPRRRPVVPRPPRQRLPTPRPPRAAQTRPRQLRPIPLKPAEAAEAASAVAETGSKPPKPRPQAAEDADGDLPWIFSYVARRYAWIFSVAMLVLFLFSCSSTTAKSVEPSWFQKKTEFSFHGAGSRNALRRFTKLCYPRKTSHRKTLFPSCAPTGRGHSSYCRDVASIRSLSESEDFLLACSRMHRLTRSEDKQEAKA